MIEYKSREYCNDIKCPVQMQLNELEVGSYDYGKAKLICYNHCRAYKFHHWLDKNGYKIIKEE